jgi:transcriptional regulator of acetoin/glycerol metabolism
MDSRSPSISNTPQAEETLVIAESASTEFVGEVANSWQRCANEYHVDPDGRAAPQILAAGEIKAHREPLEKLVFTARGEIDRLYSMIRASGYVLLLCDITGSTIEHRPSAARAGRARQDQRGGVSRYGWLIVGAGRDGGLRGWRGMVTPPRRR